ncbi:MAG: hypothetical protein ACTSVV_03275, partial [Promethearchaeota archaeon]
LVKIHLKFKLNNFFQFSKVKNEIYEYLKIKLFKYEMPTLVQLEKMYRKEFAEDFNDFSLLYSSFILKRAMDM